MNRGTITKGEVETTEKGGITFTPEQTADPMPLHWSDALLLEQRNRVHPLTLIARAFSLLDAISTRAVEHGLDSSDAIQEINFALKTLTKAGEFHTAGLFLTRLEMMIPPREREHWPLSETIMAELTE